MQLSASTKENKEISEDFGEKLKMNNDSDEKLAPKQEEGENEEEFSFACSNPDGSPISAEDVFQNGKIRPIFPLFDQSLVYRDSDDGEDGMKNDSQPSPRPPLRKLFIEDQSDFEKTDVTEEQEPAGPFCEWSSVNKMVKEASTEPCKKSNSTGFSKLWRFRELVLRSNSDGKDAFVFLNNNNNDNNSENLGKSSERSAKSSEKPEKSSTSAKTSKGDKVVKATADNKKAKPETVSSVYEKHYLRNRVMKEGDKRKSYSPYRQDLVGFFTNVNGLSRNVHPY